jgi:hypothetical protein
MMDDSAHPARLAIKGSIVRRTNKSSPQFHNRVAQASSEESFSETSIAGITQ